LKFSTTFKLSEGDNTITVTATCAYDPTLKGEATVSGTLDTTPPEVSIDPLPPFTKQVSLTISGTAYDDHFSLLTVTLNGMVVLTQRAAQLKVTNWQWSRMVTLIEGENIIEAIAEDKAGLKATAKTTIILDTTAPTLKVLRTIYPTGEYSGRPGDMVIFQVNASDAETGIDKVQIGFPGEPGQPPFWVDMMPVWRCWWLSYARSSAL